jgi:hypothetical protein
MINMALNEIKKNTILGKQIKTIQEGRCNFILGIRVKF